MTRDFETINYEKDKILGKKIHDLQTIKSWGNKYMNERSHIKCRAEELTGPKSSAKQVLR